MTNWILTCPHCGEENDTVNGTVIIECGTVSSHCVCVNCRQDIDDQQEYWRWLGLAEKPPDEPDR